MRTYLTALGLAAALVGCGPTNIVHEWDPAPITNAGELEYWSQASAPRIYTTTAMITIAVAMSADQNAANGCPVRTIDGSETTFTGGCTDTEGNEWSGKLVMTGSTSSEDGTGHYVFDNFQLKSTEACDAGGSLTERFIINGTWVAEASDNPAITNLDFDLTIDSSSADTVSCTLSSDVGGWDYTGTREESGARTIWNGKGVMGIESEGRMAGETVDEVVDNGACASEALAGTTTLSPSNGEVVITYDGNTNCTDPGTVTWTLDGTDMGVVSNVACSTVATAPAWAAAGLLLLALRRRRR